MQPGNWPAAVWSAENSLTVPLKFFCCGGTTDGVVALALEAWRFTAATGALGAGREVLRTTQALGETLTSCLIGVTFPGSCKGLGVITGTVLRMVGIPRGVIVVLITTGRGEGQRWTWPSATGSLAKTGTGGNPTGDKARSRGDARWLDNGCNRHGVPGRGDTTCCPGMRGVWADGTVIWVGWGDKARGWATVGDTGPDMEGTNDWTATGDKARCAAPMEAGGRPGESSRTTWTTAGAWSPGPMKRGVQGQGPGWPGWPWPGWP